MSELPSAPLEVDRMFVRAMNEHDIETVMQTYDESTVFVQGPGRENISGLDNIRRVIEEFLALKPTLTVALKQFVQADDIALFSVEWVLEGTDGDGERVLMRGADSNVVRRRDDGSWFTLIDNPMHREFLDAEDTFAP